MDGFSKALIAAVGLIGLGASVPATAAPVAPAPIGQAARDDAPVQDVRLYCHRGPVFLHWGPCAHDAWKFNYYRWHRPYYHRHYYRRYYW